jgi:LSD1 subclass zinc finger protein
MSRIVGWVASVVVAASLLGCGATAGQEYPYDWSIHSDGATFRAWRGHVVEREDGSAVIYRRRVGYRFTDPWSSVVVRPGCRTYLIHPRGGYLVRCQR